MPTRHKPWAWSKWLKWLWNPDTLTTFTNITELARYAPCNFYGGTFFSTLCIVCLQLSTRNSSSHFSCCLCKWWLLKRYTALYTTRTDYPLVSGEPARNEYLEFGGFKTRNIFAGNNNFFIEREIALQPCQQPGETLFKTLIKNYQFSIIIMWGKDQEILVDL